MFFMYLRLKGGARSDADRKNNRSGIVIHSYPT